MGPHSETWTVVRRKMSVGFDVELRKYQKKRASALHNVMTKIPGIVGLSIQRYYGKPPQNLKGLSLNPNCLAWKVCKLHYLNSITSILAKH